MVDLRMSQPIINLSFLSPQPTGLSVYATNILPYLSDLNPIAISTAPIPNYSCHLINTDFTHHSGTRKHLDRLWWTQFQLPKIYHQLKSQLLFSPVPEAPIFTDCRYIVTAHDFIPLHFPKKFSTSTVYHRYYVPHILNQAQHIICNSQATAKDIGDFFDIPTSKITPIPLAYDRQHFQFLNLPTKNYFLYIGRQEAYKNLRRIISAFCEIPQSQDYELWLVGSTDLRYRPALDTQITALGMTDRIKFLEYVHYSDLPKIINQAMALVFPSLWEGFGLPILEAMACGTPVITSNLASMPEVAGDAAILVDPYDTNQIADAMRMVAEDSQLRSKLRQSGLARAKQFSWEKTGKATAMVLERYL